MLQPEWMKTRIELSNEKVFGLALATIAIAAGIWAINRYGPRPEKTTPGQTSANQPVSSPTSNQDGGGKAFGGDLFDALFKASTSPLASGRAGDSPAKYLETLEEVYRRRGYRRFEPAGGGSGARLSVEESRNQRVNQMRGKIYWRTDAGGVSTIAAWGEDADPNTEITSAKSTGVQKQMYLTAVSPAEGGGSRWTTYRYMADSPELRALHDQMQSNGDWPGQDPLDVPRPSGLRRLISIGRPNNQDEQSKTDMVIYQSQQRVEPLAEWYMKEMPLAGWSFNPPAGESGEKTRGVLHFTKGHRSCLVWINPGAGSDPTSVIISARAM